MNARKKELGTIALPTGRAFVTDPGYPPDAQHAHTLSVLPGNYNCKVTILESRRHGARPFVLEAVHESRKLPYYSEEAPFKVFVDSGQASIIEEESYRKLHASEKSEDAFYRKLWPLTSITGKKGGAGLLGRYGVACASGFGDGAYRCILARNKNRDIVAIKVVFT